MFSDERGRGGTTAGSAQYTPQRTGGIKSKSPTLVYNQLPFT